MSEFSQNISDINTWQKSLGGLHDVEICQMNLDILGDSLTIQVEDLDANIYALASCTQNTHRLIFKGIKELVLDLVIIEGIRIGSTSVFEEKGVHTIKFDLNIGGGHITRGKASISVSFESMEIA